MIAYTDLTNVHSDVLQVIIDTVKSVQEHLIVDHKKRPPYRQGDQQGTFKVKVRKKFGLY